jgi:diguanylate cyclase (GGDEF)-like protein
MKVTNMHKEQQSRKPATPGRSRRTAPANPGLGQSRRRSDRQLHSIVDSMPGFVFRRVMATDGTVSYPYLSPNIHEWRGIDPAEKAPRTKTFPEYLHPEDRQLFVDAMALSARELSSFEVAVRLGTAKDRPKWLRIVSYPRKLANGNIPWDCIALDIAEAKAWEAHLSYHDSLTGLPNRALFVNWLNHALSRSEQLEAPAFVIALELISLANIRESSGFEVGDACIQETARRLQRTVQFADTIAYTGGGGFLIVLIQVDRKNDFTAPLRAIKRQFEARYEVAGQDFPLSIAMGISVVPGDGDQAETLVGNATTALNKAKDNPSFPYQFYDSEMTERAVMRLGIDSELRRAIENQELMLFYQPQYDSQTLRVVGVEALIRWQHPVRGLVLPGEFIPGAEETGLIVPLGEFALREACKQASDWQSQGVTDVPVSVNLSGVQLRQSDLSERILAILAETGLAASQLKLELTESTIVNNAAAAARTMTYLAEAGVGFSVDDFGIEHSALSHLSRLPINALKIDYSFVSQMTTCRVHAALVQAIISMTHSMGMSVVAEGVETQAQLTYLQAYQCDVLQGFLLGKPQPAKKLEALLKRQSLKQDKAVA